VNSEAGGDPKAGKELLAQALAQGKKEWRRSKLSVVGEGRAGKTALTRSIIGRAFEETASTVGINQLTCDVKHVTTTGSAAGEQQWGECTHAERELESALAGMISTINAAASQMQPQPAAGSDIVAFMRNSQPAAAEGDPSCPPFAVTNSTPAKETQLRPEEGTANPSALPSSAVQGSEGAPQGPKEQSPAMDLDEEMVMKTLATMQDAHTGLLISLFDFGGQSVFDVIHHLFLTRNGVFNMEWLVKDGPEKEKALRFMRNWLSSIVVHTYDRVHGTCAPVVFVGTRLDTITSGAEHEAISTVLYERTSLTIWPGGLSSRTRTDMTATARRSSGSSLWTTGWARTDPRCGTS
jgi:GTPase SAR1 family protein